MKNALPRQMKRLARKRPPSKSILLCAGLVAIAFQATALPSQSSPEESIRRFFDFLVGSQVQTAADLALFSDAEAKTGFIAEWTEKAPSLSGYTIEGWTIETREGSADIALHFRQPSPDESLHVTLVNVNGIWNVAPEKDFKPAASSLPPPPTVEKLENLVHVRSSRNEKRIELSVVNEAPCSVLFRLEMSLPASLRPDRALPLRCILPPSKDPLLLLNLRVAGRSPVKYSWRYTVKRADDSGEMVPAGKLTPLPKVSVRDEARFFVGGKYAYGLPYPAGKSYLIWQGPGGSFSHSEPGSRYAVDFSLPTGSEVAAARSGVVIGVIQKNPDNPEGETAPAYMANEVLILHADGTIAVYAHLTTDGARVSFGQTVRRGETVGLSGNSGYSRGPHLHFAILGYSDQRCLSIPFGFLSAEGTLLTPRKGLILLTGNDGTATMAPRETFPRRVVRNCHEEFYTEIRYFAKRVDLLAVNKTDDLLGIELSFSSMENLISPDELPRRIGLPADGTFHEVLSLEVIDPEEKCSFTYVFRRVEPPGREHIPLRVERDAGDGYVIEIRYFSDRIEFYAENATSRPMVGLLDFPSLVNVTPNQELPVHIHLPADRSAHYLATLAIVRPAKGYSFAYEIGPFENR